jgi:crotonobetaine/carnitine-CoA ligase
MNTVDVACAYPPEQRVLSLILEQHAKDDPARPFVSCDGRWLTLGELHARAGRAAAGLLRLGLEPRDRVCTMLTNTLDYVVASFAVPRMAGVEIPVNTGFEGDDLHYIIENGDAAGIIIDAAYWDRLAPLLPKLARLKVVAVCGRPASVTTNARRDQHVVNFEGLESDGPLPPSPRFTDLAQLLYTSGTTGHPKGVMYSHHGLFWWAEQHRIHLRITRDDVLYSCLPYFYQNTRLSTATALITGAKIVLGKEFDPTRFWDEIRACGATYFSSLGTMGALLLKEPKRPDDDNNSVRVVFIVPAPPPEFHERFNVTSVTPYGLTESNIITYTPYDAPRAGSAGRATTGFDVHIVDDDDGELPARRIGEIVSRPQMPYTMMDGYYGMPEKTLEVMRNLWFHTGDLGYVDDDGYLYFVDRKKDAIRRQSQFVTTGQVEDVVHRHPAVKEAVAVPLRREGRDDEIKLVVLLGPGASLTEGELNDFCLKEMPSNMWPRYIEFKSELPKTLTQKVERYRLQTEGVTAKTWDTEARAYCERKR